MNTHVKLGSYLHHTSIETCGDIVLDQYLVETGDGVSLSLLRINKAEAGNLTPIVLVHGSYTNRRFWLSKKGVGLASFLNEEGYDVWILETRGHGFSVNKASFNSLTADGVIATDIPVAVNLIAEVNRQKQVWVGHSYGGLYILGALGSKPEIMSNVSAVAVFGTQLKYGQSYLKFPPLTWTIKQLNNVLKSFPATKLGMGSEDEPPSLMNQVLDWKMSGEWLSLTGVDYFSGLARIKIPVLMVAGGGDTTDPAPGCELFFEMLGSESKDFWNMSVKNGWLENYGHAEMLISKNAQQELWPKLSDWVQRVP